ncbi:glycosyltransferase family 1 protein [Escherichia albertii]|uniref:glycosyltransferase family 4 protein n=1 Tax=Escherichia albertii TaxID=208962 RepID=UPI0030C90343
MYIIIDARMINASGIGTYIKNLLREINKHESIRLQCVINQEHLEEIKNIGISDYIIFRSRFFSPLEQIEYIFKLPSADIFWTPHFNTSIFSLRNKFKKRVVTIHDMFPFAYREHFKKTHFLYIKFLMKKAAEVSDLILTVSNFSKTQIIDYLNVSERKISAVPLGVDPDFLNTSNLPNVKKKYILCVGNVKPHKNIKRAIKAFISISDKIPFYDLIIVGKSEGFYSPEDNLEELIQGNERIHFTGFVTIDALKKYYSEASMLLFPSLYEGFGLPLLEAMSFGLPIAASSRGSLPEVGKDAIIYFDPESIEHISLTIVGIISGEMKCDTLAYRSILNEYTWKKCATETLNSFNKLVRDK